ncbi:hypothetical protein K0M31_001429, partial [Melipona bicolor]
KRIGHKFLNLIDRDLSAGKRYINKRLVKYREHLCNSSKHSINIRFNSPLTRPKSYKARAAISIKPPISISARNPKSTCRLPSGTTLDAPFSTARNSKGLPVT